MFSKSHRAFVWIARSAGIALILLASMFALDAFDGRPLSQAIPAFLIHLLPAAAVGIVVLAAWRWPWAGAAGFAALAIAYIMSVPTRLDWILVIAGPLMTIAILFALDAMSRPRVVDQAGRARP